MISRLSMNQACPIAVLHLSLEAHLHNLPTLFHVRRLIPVPNHQLAFLWKTKPHPPKALTQSLVARHQCHCRLQARPRHRTGEPLHRLLQAKRPYRDDLQIEQCHQHLIGPRTSRVKKSPSTKGTTTPTSSLLHRGKTL